MRAWGVGVSPHPSAGTGLTPDSGGSVSLRVPHQSRRESIRGSGDSPHVSALETALQNLLPKVLARPLRSAFGTTSQLTRDPATPALGGGNHVGDAEIRLQDAVNTPVALTHPSHARTAETGSPSANANASFQVHGYKTGVWGPLSVGDAGIQKASCPAGAGKPRLPCAPRRDAQRLRASLRKPGRPAGTQRGARGSVWGSGKSRQQASARGCVTR